mmetsp:Transcript_13338/g.14457  ORF Transcript_13338/g.14457 Transcript_13338/m.14457 type:complete len:88 (-) Transcript_13338:164-427(-)|eukprot:CAMPEP_0173152430 /NCGR_PEP_ID=MMETSP1105-20130129/12234_1 /TAXON_ID=2985 /ORGANISM="Ochromonas sp., Strain BG-1" /LENGTH=87 /DNA_ID=CAMNT_0014068121 /DNA_START=43 /DNA_END=306 /DNA_ORIENTATION=+
MFSRVARRAAQAAQKRNFSLFDTKNTINERRAKFYSNPAVGADNPTYLKEPGDQVFVAIGLAGTAIGLGVILRGLYSMSLGVNKVSK